VGFQGLADRMVNDFVRVADEGSDDRGAGGAGLAASRGSAVVRAARGATVADALASACLPDQENASGVAVFGVSAVDTASARR
jgi:hypothetical protein